MECPGLAGLWRQCPGAVVGLQPYERDAILAVAVPLALLLLVVAIAFVTLLVAQLTEGVPIGLDRRTTDRRGSREERIERARRHLARSSRTSATLTLPLLVDAFRHAPPATPERAAGAVSPWRRAEDVERARGVRSGRDAWRRLAAGGDVLAGWVAASRVELRSVVSGVAAGGVALRAAAGGRFALRAAAGGRFALHAASHALRDEAGALRQELAPRASALALRARDAVAHGAAVTAARTWLVPSVPASLHAAVVVGAERAASAMREGGTVSADAAGRGPTPATIERGGTRKAPGARSRSAGPLREAAEATRARSTGPASRGRSRRAARAGRAHRASSRTTV